MLPQQWRASAAHAAATPHNGAIHLRALLCVLQRAWQADAAALPGAVHILPHGCHLAFTDPEFISLGQATTEHIYICVVGPQGSRLRGIRIVSAHDSGRFVHRELGAQLLEPTVQKHHRRTGLFHNPLATHVHDKGHQDDAPGNEQVPLAHERLFPMSFRQGCRSTRCVPGHPDPAGAWDAGTSLQGTYTYNHVDVHVGSGCGQDKTAHVPTLKDQTDNREHREAPAAQAEENQTQAKPEIHQQP